MKKSKYSYTYVTWGTISCLVTHREDVFCNYSTSQSLFLNKRNLVFFREEIALLRSGSGHKLQHHTQHSNEDKNDHLTVKWLTGSVAEIKTELSEIQTTLNSTVIFQNHEQVDAELKLLKSDVQNLNKELETARIKNAKYEAEILEIREEIGSLRDQSRATAVMCGKSKNQVSKKLVTSFVARVFCG